MCPPARAHPPLLADAVLRRLRALLRDAGVPWLGRLTGWAERDGATPACQWEGVGCRDGRIAYL